MNERFEDELVKRYYNADRNPFYLSSFNINELYLDKQEGWTGPITTDQLKELIKNDGPQNIVLMCAIHDMMTMSGISQSELDMSLVDNGFQTFCGVEQFERTGNDLVIVGTEDFVCSLNVCDEWRQYHSLELTKMARLFEPGVQEWLNQKKWDGNSDMSWDDGRTF